jgi:integrase/recombinase XerD
MNKAEHTPLISGYISYIKDIKRLSPGTIKDIRCSLNRLQYYTEGIDLGKEIWQLRLEEYIRWVGHEREAGKSSQTLSKQISHVRGLLEYAYRNGRLDRNVLEGFHLQDSTKRQLPRVLSQEEARKLVNACRSKTKQDRKERIIILLLYGCGLRTSELCNVNVQDIDQERRELLVRKGKGDIQRKVPVPEGVWTELLAYICARGGKRGALLKTETRHARYRVHLVGKTVRETSRRAGLQTGITPKVLRHSFATHLMEAGVDIGMISQLMGHRSPRETGIYLHSGKTSRRNAVERLDGTPTERKIS